MGLGNTGAPSGADGDRDRDMAEVSPGVSWYSLRSRGPAQPFYSKCDLEDCTVNREGREEWKAHAEGTRWSRARDTDLGLSPSDSGGLLPPAGKLSFKEDDRVDRTAKGVGAGLDLS